MAEGDMVALSGSVGDIDTSDNLTLFEAYQKIFVVNGDNLKVADFINTRLTSEAQITTNIPTKGSLLTQDTTGAVLLVDYIYYDDTASDHYVYGYNVSGTFNTTNDVKDADSNTIITGANLSAVTSSPHWYDWQPYNEDTTTYGEMPDEAYLGCLYRGRCVLSGNPADPYQWYMSRQANPFDWLYAQADAQSPVAGNNGDAGKLGDIVRALIPYSDEYLIFGGSHSISVLRGDPATNGRIDDMDRSRGIFSGTSWTFDGNDNLWFMTSSGDIAVIPSGLGRPEDVSRGVLPNMASDVSLNPTTHRVTMAYDSDNDGILISLTTLLTGANECYWYDLTTKGFFPESYSATNGIYSMFNYQANDSDNRKLLVGCQDGYIRDFDNSSKDDDTTNSTATIDSYVTMPLIQAENNDQEVKVTSTTVTLAGGASAGNRTDSDGVDIETFVADDAETLIEAIEDGDSPLNEESVSGPGRATRLRARSRGQAVGIRLHNDTAAETWALEKISVETKTCGKLK